VHHHGGSLVRSLDWDSFDKLCKIDRHLSIKDLYVSHRADYIRSYLLRHYGGIWIDADCLIMKDLAPLAATAEVWDYIFYKQRDGAISNAFIGARTDSETARHFYDGIVWRLCQEEAIGWTDLGQTKLVEAINNADANCLQLATESISAVDWSESSSFCEKGSPDDHSKKYYPRSLAVMLSNHSMGGMHSEVNDSLMHKDSLFQFLVKKSLGR
jgi:hypothetical protein